MINVIALNPCVDKTVEVEILSLGATNRALLTRSDIGGKGINVSLVLKELGEEQLNFLFDYTASNISVPTFLENNGVRTCSVKVDAPLRTNLKIFERKTDTMTEINDPGQPIEPKAYDKLTTVIAEQLRKADVAVFCGSIPVGVSKGAYAQLIEQANRNSIKTVLDAYGEAFKLGVKAKPTLVKPNLQELEEYTNCKISNYSQLKSAADKMLESGVEFVCVSVGENGAYLFTCDGAWYTKGAKVEVKGLQGAGDSMVASFAQSLVSAASPEIMLARAVAAAQATVMRSGTQLCRKADYDSLLKLITVIKL